MADPLLQRLGARLRELRVQQDRTQEEIAERAGVAANYVSAIERGTKSPTIETLARIAAPLDTSLSELFVGVDRPLPARYRRLESALAGRSAESAGTVLDLVEVALRLDTGPSWTAREGKPRRRGRR